MVDGYNGKMYIIKHKAIIEIIVWHKGVVYQNFLLNHIYIQLSLNLTLYIIKTNTVLKNLNFNKKNYNFSE